MTVKSQSLSLREFVQKRSAEGGGGEGFPEVTPNLGFEQVALPATDLLLVRRVDGDVQ